MLPFLSAHALHGLRRRGSGFLDHLRIRNKLILMTLLTGLLPLLAFYGMNTADSEAMLTGEVATRGSLFARVTTERITSYFEDRAVDGLTLASSELIREGLTAFNAFTLDTAEKEAMATRFQRFFSTPTEAHGYTDLFLTNKYGEIIYSQNYDPLDLAPLVFDGTFTEEAMAGRQNWTAPFRNTFIDDQLMILATPVHGDGGEVQGTLNIVLNQAQIDAIVTSGIGEHGTTARAYLLDGEGRLLNHPTPSDTTGLLVPLAKGEAPEKVATVLSQETDSAPLTAPYTSYDGREVIGTLDTVRLGDQEVGLAIELERAEAYRTLHAMKQHARLFVVGLGLFSLLLAYLIARSIATPLQNVTRSADALATLELKRLDREIVRKDEIGDLQRAMQRIAGQLIDMVGELKEASGTLGASSAHLAEGASEGSRIASEVSGALESVALAMQDQTQDAEEGAALTTELAEILTQEKGYLGQLIDATRTMTERVREGSAISGELKAHTDQVSDAHRRIQERIGRTHESAQKIREVTGYIRSIADQTNLLSLNASIEAARAGRHGAGFSVVAGEIKKLAEDAKEATASIDELIGTLNRETGETVDTLGTLLTRAATQSESVEKTQEAFTSIHRSLDDSRDHLKRLERSGGEVSVLRNELKERITHLSQLTRGISENTTEISSATEEQAAAAEALRDTGDRIDGLAAHLGRLIGRFQIHTNKPIEV
jgi:methyl-accepting chemotaxis protein